MQVRASRNDEKTFFSSSSKLCCSNSYTTTTTSRVCGSISIWERGRRRRRRLSLIFLPRLLIRMSPLHATTTRPDPTRAGVHPPAISSWMGVAPSVSSRANTHSNTHTHTPQNERRRNLGGGRGGVEKSSLYQSKSRGQGLVGWLGTFRPIDSATVEKG